MSTAGAIALFGGTFNPFHFGHLRTAQELLIQLPITELRFVPARIPPHRAEPLVGADHRAAMVALAVAHEPRFRCDRRELERMGPSYTVDTLESVRAEVGAARPLALVMGCDAFQGLDTWHRWEELLDLAHIIVVARPGWTWPAADGVARGDKLDSPATLLRDRRIDADQLVRAPAGGVLSCGLTPQDISSTVIRALLQSSDSTDGLVPSAVQDYIRAHGLYGSEP